MNNYGTQNMACSFMGAIVTTVTRHEPAELPRATVWRWVKKFNWASKQ